MTLASTSRLCSMASVRPLRVITLSNFVCLQCRLHASAAARRQNPSSKPLITSRQYASLTDRLRKKIWGSENPPGQEDPYGGKSILDQRKKELDLEDERRDPRVQVAPSPEDVEDESVALGYVAKTTWDGMDRVGYEGWGKEEWDKDHPFKGYMNSKRTNRQEIMTGIHRALVEVYTLKQEGLPLTDYSAFDLDDDYARRLAEGTKFEDDAFQGKRLVFENEELRQQVLESTKAKDGLVEETDQQEALEAAEYAEEEATGREAEPIPEQETTASIVSRDDVEGEPHADDELADEASEAACYHILGGEYLIKPTDDSWREISFEDPHVKFAVLKRVMQLTGTRIPDPDITTITNTKALLGHLVRKPKAKRLADSLFANEVAELPNIQIIDRRYTPIDKEKEVGRWKVIEKELTARGLPITGTDAGIRNMTVAS